MVASLLVPLNQPEKGCPEKSAAKFRRNKTGKSPILLLHVQLQEHTSKIRNLRSMSKQLSAGAPSWTMKLRGWDGPGVRIAAGCF